MICVRPAGRGQTINIAIFLSETVNEISVRLCIMVLLIELFVLKALSVTLTIFQGQSTVKQFQLNFFVLFLLIQLCSNCVQIVVNYVS